jgi:carboxymethylenebutenolidase
MYRSEIVSVQGHANNSPMEVLIFEPEGNGPHPGLIIAQHIPLAHTGLHNDDWQIDVGERYARAGYMVAMPFIFHWWPKEADIQLKRDEFRDDDTLADLRATYQLLATMEDVDAQRIGMLGHCWGGRVSWLGACHIAQLRACVVLYGGRIKLAFADKATAPIELAGDIRAPVLGLFGNDDQSPSPQDVDDYEAALNAANVPNEFHRYDGAGHGFQDFNKPERYRETASNDAWQKCIAFLDRHLK